MSCFGINFARLYVSSIEKQYRSLGLASKLFDLEDGTTIHCWVPEASTHKGKPCLMLVHGFGMDGLLGWTNQVKEFSEKYALYVPDLVFFGKSTTRSKERSESFQAECLIKVLLKEGHQQAFVVGTSYGGMVCFRMAQLAPGLIKKAVIADSGVCMTPRTNEPVLEEFGATHIHEVLLPTSVKVQKKSLRLAVYKPPAFLPDCVISQLMEEFGFNREERIQLLDALVIGTPVAFPLPKLSQEVLILWGEHDRIFQLKLAHELQAHFGEKSKLVVIPNAGHVPQAERPKEFNRHVLSFLAEAE